MAIFNEKYSDSFYFLTDNGEKLYPVMQRNRATGHTTFRIGSTGSARILNHLDPKKCVLEVNESEMFDYVINQEYFTRFEIAKGDEIQRNYRAIQSKDIEDVIIHPDWLHLKK